MLDDPGSGGPLGVRLEPEPLHEDGNDPVLCAGDGAVGARLGKEQLRDAGQSRGAFVAVEAVQALGGVLAQLAAQALVVQEHRLLDERNHVARVGDSHVVLARPLQQGVAEPGGQVLRLAAGQLEGGVLGPVAGAEPAVVVAPQHAGVVLQLDQVELVAGEDEEVDLVPAAVVVPELEVRPGAVGRGVGEEFADVVEAVGLVLELGGRDLDPAVVTERQDSPSS